MVDGMGWFKKNDEKGETQPAASPQPAARPPPPSVEMIGFKKQDVAKEVTITEAEKKTCPQCKGNDLEIFEDGSFICMTCEYVSGGLAKEAVDSELQAEEGAKPGAGEPPPAAAPPPPAVTPAPPPQPGYQMGISAPKVSTTEALGRLDRFEETLGEISSKVSKHEDMYNRIYSDVEEIKNKLARIEASTLELQGLYDSVSMLFNPFIEVNADLIREFIDTIKTLDPEVLKSLTKEDIQKGEEIEDLFKAETQPQEPPKPATCPTCGQVVASGGTQIPVTPRPILEGIPGDVTSSMISIQWLNFMIDRVGPENIPALLEFYRKLNWISQDVKTSMLLQMKGMKYDTKITKDDWKMEPKDHLKSLIYIHKIKGTELDRDTLERLEKDLQNI
jgi:archaellum component FlaD/FlaE/ribosomal protein L37AE/L43A